MIGPRARCLLECRIGPRDTNWCLSDTVSVAFLKQETRTACFILARYTLYFTFFMEMDYQYVNSKLGNWLFHSYHLLSTITSNQSYLTALSPPAAVVVVKPSQKVTYRPHSLLQELCFSTLSP